MKTKTLALAITSILMFTGCFGGDDTEVVEDLDKSHYQTDEFSIKPPADWEVIGANKFPSTVSPKLVVAFQSNFRDPIFTSTVSIHKEMWAEGESVSSEDFYKNSKRKIKSNTLMNFNEVAVEEVDVIKGEEFLPGIITVYEGKQRSYENIIRFRELYVTDANVGFMVTAAYLPDEDEGIVKSIEEMLNSFRIK